MPAVAPPAKALVTGANGFVAVWVVQTLLEEGYSVVGIVRSAPKGDYLKKKFASFGDKFEIKVVEDIAAVCICIKTLAVGTWSYSTNSARCI